jgi:hypothetical protein
MPTVIFPGFNKATPFTVALLEDDYGQMEIYRELADHASGHVKIMPFFTEREFHEYYSDPNTTLPNGFILDLFVRWSRPGDSSRSETLKGSDWPSDEAGIRCKDLIRQRSKSVPVILWTVTETDHIEPARLGECTFARKSDYSLERALRILRDIGSGNISR